MAPWQQGVLIIALIAFSSLVSVQSFRVVQNTVNIVMGLALLATIIVILSGVVWLVRGHQSVTNFADFSQWKISWNPKTTNIGLFGTITLAYLGTAVPLNMGGEIIGRKVITRHLLLGTLIVLGAYILTTLALLIVKGQSVAASTSNPAALLISTVDTAFGANPPGKFLGSVTALGIISFFVIVPIVYNFAFARLLLVAGIDQRLPVGVGKLNKQRVPANAILFQSTITILLTMIIFFIVPYVTHLGDPAALAKEVYFVVLAATTLVWAVSSTFFFVNLGVFYIRDRRLFHLHRIFPMPVLFICSIVGPVASLAAIVDTLLNSWIIGYIDDAHWWYIVGGLTLFCLIIAAIGSMFGTSEAAWEGLSNK
jgi:glutamate:GABA antiporter